jgi:hypothetical protein
LEEGEEHLGNGFEGTMSVPRLVNVLLCNNTHQGSMEKPNSNRFLHVGVQRTPQVKIHHMVGWVFS